MSKPLISTRLEEQTFKALQEIARHQERKLAFLVRKAVEQFVQAADRPRKTATRNTG